MVIFYLNIIIYCIMDKLKSKKILVTGGAGFIGSNIVEYLLDNNCSYVRVVDNLSTGNMKNIKFLMDKCKNMEFIEGDIRDIEICREVTRNIDVICHQAAIGSVPRSVNDPLFSHQNNVDGAFNILLAAKENKVKRVVYASSSSVYGDNQDLPKVENFIGKQLSPYAITKYVNELYARIFTDCYEMECIGLRYFNVFGPRQDPNGAYAAVIPKFVSDLINKRAPIINGDGSFSRDFTYVDNVVQANVLAMSTENKNAFGNVFNIANGGRTTILDLFVSIKKSLNSNLEPEFTSIRKGDIPHSNACIQKAKDILGYKPKISFDNGIKKTIAYYKEN